MEQEASYRLTSGIGDIVKMPNGVIGVVDGWDIWCGHFKRVRVRPLTASWLHRLWLKLPGNAWYGEEQIDQLKPLWLAPRS